MPWPAFNRAGISPVLAGKGGGGGGRGARRRASILSSSQSPPPPAKIQTLTGGSSSPSFCPFCSLSSFLSWSSSGRRVVVVVTRYRTSSAARFSIRISSSLGARPVIHALPGIITAIIHPQKNPRRSLSALVGASTRRLICTYAGPLPACLTACLAASPPLCDIDFPLIDVALAVAGAAGAGGGGRWCCFCSAAAGASLTSANCGSAAALRACGIRPGPCSVTFRPIKTSPWRLPLTESSRTDQALGRPGQSRPSRLIDVVESAD